MPFLNIPSGRIFYKETPASDPSQSKATLVLHHGLGSTHAYHQVIAPSLSAPPHNFRCITYDAISCGLSSLATGPQSISTIAQDVISVLDALKIEKAVFVGHSFAGIVAAQLAAKNAERILGAVMLGPVLPSENVAKVFEARVGVIEEKGMEAMADTIPNGATGPNATPLQRAFIRQLLLAQDPKGYQSMCKVVRDAEVLDYASIQIPTLIIAGGEDKSAPLAGCKEIQERIGSEDKRFKVVEKMGHWHCIEEPDVMAEEIGRFTSSIV